jgi:hypothetical protein
MYYVPAQYPGAYNFIFTNEGEWINPTSLTVKHPWIRSLKSNNFMDNLPDEMKDQLIKYKRKHLTNTDISWNSYRDCPFVNKKMIAEYMAISETGWYSKMYEMMVSIAVIALRKKYPIQADEIAQLCKEIDEATGGWYKDRPLAREADNALKFAYSKV